MDEPTQPHPVKRLVVQLDQRTDQLLEDLVTIEEMNKTTLVNRAVQVYSFIGEVQRAGGRAYIQEADTDTLRLLRLI